MCHLEQYWGHKSYLNSCEEYQLSFWKNSKHVDLGAGLVVATEIFENKNLK